MKTIPKYTRILYIIFPNNVSQFVQKYRNSYGQKSGPLIS